MSKSNKGTKRTIRREEKPSRPIINGTGGVRQVPTPKINRIDPL
jgi:hypothetical protein